MKGLNSLELIISDSDHVIISGDSAVYKIIKSGIHDSFDDYIDEDYKKIYLDNLALADKSWFPVRIMSDMGSNLFCIRASRKKTGNTDAIRLELVQIEDLFESRRQLADMINIFKSQLELYDDVFFDYDPDEQTVTMVNTQAATFDAGVYSTEEIERILGRKLSPKDRERIRSFMGQIRSKAGRFTTRIEANILNDDPGIFATMLEAKYLFCPGGKEYVVGHIHPEHKRKNDQIASLKRDSLTGLLEKSEITRLAKERIDDRHIEGTALAIVDIDFFKSINDTYGHQFGDTVIKRVSDIISAEVGDGGTTGRFGGDEFLLLFYSVQEEELRTSFRNMKRKMKDVFADVVTEMDTPLSLSIGAASFPGDAGNYEDLFILADHCLYIAKEKGRNRYVIYDRDKHGSLKAIQQQEMTKKILDERGCGSYGDAIITMYNVVLHGKGTTVEKLMDEFAERFDLQRTSLIVGTPFQHIYTAGKDKPEGKASPEVLLGMLNSDIKEKYLAGRDFVVVNNIDDLPPQAGAMKEFLRKIGVLSYILIRFYDRDHNECFVIISSLGHTVQWNELHFKYYRAFVDLLSYFSMKKQ